MSSGRHPPSGAEGPAFTSSGDPDDEFGPRKLIRPSLADLRKEHGSSRSPLSRKAPAPEQTNAEAFYYLKQMQTRTPVVIRLLDGEELRGCIEWYDKDVLKLNRENAPNLVIAKHAIKYLYKDDEERQVRRRKPRQDAEDAHSIDAPPGAPTR